VIEAVLGFSFNSVTAVPDFSPNFNKIPFEQALAQFSISGRDGTSTSMHVALVVGPTIEDPNFAGFSGAANNKWPFLARVRPVVT